MALQQTCRLCSFQEGQQQQQLRLAASLQQTHRWMWIRSPAACRHPHGSFGGRRRRQGSSSLQHRQEQPALSILPPLRALQVESPSQALAEEEAWSLLQEFSAREARGLAQAFLDSREKRQRLRDALLVAASAPHVPAGWNPQAAEAPEVLLGVVASDVRLAVRALRDYCQALGLPFKMPESRVPGTAAAPAIQGAVYIKYNSASGLCYATKYEGRDRGVLVQLGQRQLGHLPLGLHDEQMARPAPALG